MVFKKCAESITTDFASGFAIQMLCAFQGCATNRMPQLRYILYDRTMSLAAISPVNRSSLRLHGWLLFAWVFLTGWLFNWLLLYVLGMSSPLWRWPCSMALTYVVGFMGGCYIYLQWRKASTTDVIVRATEDEKLAYEQAEKSQQDLINSASNLMSLGQLSELFPPLLIIFLPILVILVVFLVAASPFLATEAFGGFMAEILLEFALGAAFMRHLLRPRPRPLGELPTSLLKKTWWLGAILVTFAMAMGYTAFVNYPDAVTLGQLIQMHRR
jgi:hypothetical protein